MRPLPLRSVCSVDLNMVEATIQSMAKPPRIISLNPFTIEEVLQDCIAIGAPVLARGCGLFLCPSPGGLTEELACLV